MAPRATFCSRPGPEPRRAAGLALGLALAVAAGLATGLPACTDGAGPPAGPAITSGVTRLEVPLPGSREIDVLFVIDSSPGIAPQRAKLLASYRGFVADLEAAPGGLPDLHLGVITADVGTRGPADAGGGPAIGAGPGACTSEGDRGELRRGAAVAGSFLSDTRRPDGTRARNYAGSLADAFAQLADVGEAGCAYVRPLEAARRALQGNPANAGFRREHALLAIVFVTSTDDCSFGSWTFTGGVLDPARCGAGAPGLVDVEPYAALLRSVDPDPDPDPGKVIVLGAFAPAGAPACAGASPAPRLTALAGSFPYRSDVVSICEPDLGRLWGLLVSPFEVLLGAPCFSPAPLDLDPAAPGLQPECAAWYSYVQDGARAQERIEACADAPAAAPCWQITQDAPSAAACAPGGALFQLRDPRWFGADAEAQLLAECVSR